MPSPPSETHIASGVKTTSLGCRPIRYGRIASATGWLTLARQATLAAANLVYVVLLGVGGVVFPLTKFPAGARPVLELLPTGALSTGLRDVLANGAVFPVKDVVTLAVWAVAGIGLAARYFRWE